MANGIKKNIEVLRRQARDYKDELVNIVFPDIRDAIEDRDIPEVLHKLTAIVEEAFDKMPRWFAYAALGWMGYSAGVALYGLF